MKRYRERMHTANTAIRYTRDEKRQRKSSVHVWASIRMFLNKTTIELGLLGVLCGSAITILVQHPYFQISDIRVDGLDSYAYARAKREIDEVRTDTFVRVPRNNYLLVNTGLLETRLREKIALDSLEIEKRFPHTLVVRAAERQTVFLVQAKNGSAYVAADGTLVRWYGADDVITDPQSRYIKIVLNKELQSHALRETIFDGEMMKMLSAITERLGRFDTPVNAIELVDDVGTVGIQFDSGVSVLIRLDADISVQLQKAELSIKKYPEARQIDVRFADKVFVSF